MSLSPVLQALAWALLHFLWQGALLWLLAALAFRAARAARPQVRYGMGLGLLALALALPLATAWDLYAPALPPALPVAAPGASGGAAALGALARGSSLRELLSRALPAVLLLWTFGVALAALRVAGGWWWLQRLKARMEPLGEAWEHRLRDVARAMGLRGGFRAGLTRDVATPLVIGWIRPVVLLPASLLAGLDPAAIEALLAHEVAHLLRRDALVNGLQCAVEVVLFYHPAVWWLSKRIRLERECCCDDVAVAFTGDPLRYAETLDRLDDLQPNLRTAQAANGANLMYRITRLLTPKARAPRMPFALPLVALLAAGAFALSAREPKAAALPAQQAESKPTPHPARPKAESKPGATAEAQPTPTPRREERPEVIHGRSIHFALWATKAGGPKLNLAVDRATRAEVESALARIESLVKPDMERSAEHGPIEGEWKLKPYKGSEDDLLTFKVHQVTPSEARQLF